MGARRQMQPHWGVGVSIHTHISGRHTDTYFESTAASHISTQGVACATYFCAPAFFTYCLFPGSQGASEGTQLHHKKSTDNNCWRGVEKRQPSHTDGGNENWFSHGGEWLRRFLKKPKVELPWDPAVPLLGIYLEKMKTLIWKDAWIPMFIAALFTIAKTWKQPTCPSTDEWVRWYIYTMEYYSAIKRMKYCSNMDGPRDFHK